MDYVIVIVIPLHLHPLFCPRRTHKKQKPCWFIIINIILAYSVNLQQRREQRCRTQSLLHHQVLASTFRARGETADLASSLWCLLSESKSHLMLFSSSPLLFPSCFLSHKATRLIVEYVFTHRWFLFSSSAATLQLHLPTLCLFPNPYFCLPSTIFALSPSWV